MKGSLFVIALALLTTVAAAQAAVVTRTLGGYTLSLNTNGDLWISSDHEILRIDAAHRDASIAAYQNFAHWSKMGHDNWVVSKDKQVGWITHEATSENIAYSEAYILKVDEKGRSTLAISQVTLSKDSSKFQTKVIGQWDEGTVNLWIKLFELVPQMVQDLAKQSP